MIGNNQTKTTTWPYINSSMMIIQGSMDYESYSFDESNRDISDDHVARISELVESLYLMDVFPIVADWQRRIVDGQHRFLVNKMLGLPLYTVFGDISPDDVADTNRVALQYSVDDALCVYSKLGIKSYLKLADLKTKYPFPTGYLAYLLGGHSNQSLVEGNFDVTRCAYAERVCKYLTDIATIQASAITRRTDAHVASSPAYRRAVEYLAQAVEYDHKTMITKLSKSPLKIVRTQTRDEALKLLNGLYNLHAKKVSRVDFMEFTKMGNLNDVHISGGFSHPVTRGIPYDSSVKLFSTRDYNSFGLHPYRRQHTAYYMEQMVEAVRAKNWLSLYPIVVDGNNVVLDGQRRLHAAKKLNLPVWYVQPAGVNLPMMVLAGTRKLSWSLRDYLKHFCVMGNADYIELRDIAQRYDIGLHLFTRCTSVRNDEMYHLFRSGNFKMPDRESLHVWARSIAQVKDLVLRKIIAYPFWQFASNKSGRGKLSAAVKVINEDSLRWRNLNSADIVKLIMEI